MSEIFKGLGVTITLAQPDDFLKVKETLTRIGIASKKEQRLFQSCHILHKRGQYSILHFKEMFVFDGKSNNVSEEDVLRRNTTVKLLEEWGLLKIAEPEEELETAPMSWIKVISHKDKANWILEPKYSIGNIRKLSLSENNQ